MKRSGEKLLRVQQRLPKLVTVANWYVSESTFRHIIFAYLWVAVFEICDVMWSIWNYGHSAPIAWSVHSPDRPEITVLSSLVLKLGYELARAAGAKHGSSL